MMVGLLINYRFKLSRLREECRQLVTNLLESRLGKPPKMQTGDFPSLLQSEFHAVTYG